MQNIFKAISLTSLIIITGCALTDEKEDEYISFRVKPSPLDNILIVYYPDPKSPSGANPSKINISGSGLIDMQTGSSKRVTDPFWDEPYTDNWNDIQSDRIQLSSDETKLLMQRLVDCGVFPRIPRKKPKELPTAPYVVMRSKIGLNSSFEVTNDRRFIYIAELLMAEFKNN